MKLIFSIHGIISKVSAVDIKRLHTYIPALLAAADENGPRNVSHCNCTTVYHCTYCCSFFVIVGGGGTKYRSQKI